MAAFQYYFDVRFIPQDLNSYFSKSLFLIPVIEQNKELTSKQITSKKKYIPQIIEASTVEFKKTKFSNNKKRKCK